MSRRSGLGGVTKVYRRDATNLGPAHPMEPFSLAFLDPPYGKGLAEKALVSLRDGGWLTSGALLVVEEAKAAAFAAPDGFEELERRAYDDTEFVFLRASLRRVGKGACAVPTIELLVLVNGGHASPLPTLRMSAF